ncbi:hypothetical protein Ddye_008373 [Dipteronia dyeriana]|uniref:Uncharacterized protein n=1 Tax=Dipteronia dyeriana TaxID=168575 RepID=A0AAD9X9A3_9ROSI|nr:hypothetical protein Ddye_008373 [Dipteronia dyeriana]
MPSLPDLICGRGKLWIILFVCVTGLVWIILVTPCSGVVRPGRFGGAPVSIASLTISRSYQCWRCFPISRPGSIRMTFLSFASPLGEFRRTITPLAMVLSRGILLLWLLGQRPFSLNYKVLKLL